MNESKNKINIFIDKIFNNLFEDEHRLFWGTTGKSPGFPSSYDTFMSRGNSRKACYFGTSTTYAHDEVGTLRNRQNLFSRMFCIVIDDIGTGPGSKCGPEKLPDVLMANYSWRIETSPYNFQYGFLLDEPIDNLNAANDLVKIIYGAGDWDGGGAMANKLVRLPCGMNMKDTYAVDDDYFHLSDYESPTDEFNVFTPDDLLTAVNAGVTWSDVLSGAAAKKDPRKKRGATAWREGKYLSSLNGIVDEVVSFLNDKELIVNEGPEWLDVICPWHNDHTDGGNTAGYKPLGVGDDPRRRVFHCFHGHCEDHKTHDYLNALAELGCPPMPSVDPVPELTSKWAFDAKSNDFINMKSDNYSRIPNAGFKTLHAKKVFWSEGDKSKNATEYNLIIQDDGLLRLSGTVYDPKSNRIVERMGGEKYFNEFILPNWDSKVVTNMERDIKKFTSFIKYLMPRGDDAEWFLNHLAAKVQDASYRGPGVLLTTPVQGSGRGTIGKILSKLWGDKNTSTVGLGEMINGFSGEGYNDWMKVAWSMVPEAKESGMSYRQEAKAYESLKTGIDPAPTSHTIKTKWGSQEKITIYASYVICSNNRDVLNIPSTDRRCLYIRCTTNPKPVTYFDELNSWLDHGNWEPSIWLMLKNRVITGHSGFAPVNDVEDAEGIKQRLIESMAGQSLIDRIATGSILFIEEHCDGVLNTDIVCSWIAQYEGLLKVPAQTNWDTVLRKVLNNQTEQLIGNGNKKYFKRTNTKKYLRHTMQLKGRASNIRVQENNDVSGYKELINAVTAEDFRDYMLDLYNEADI